MKKILLTGLVFLGVILPNTFVSGVELKKTITIGSNTYSYFDAYRLIDSRLVSNGIQEIFEKYETYTELLSLSEKKYQSTGQTLYKQLAEILEIGKISNAYELENTVQKIELGESQLGKKIYGYAKGLPENGYKLITANIHGAYEYGTYETAMMLIEELRNTSATGWFIIPTLNPDGLELYFQNGKQQSFYLEGRDTANGVDLNRNFCSQNFIYTEFYKYGKPLLTAREYCGSEKESQVFMKTAETYRFTHMISLHSTGKIFYIPDNSIDDRNVINLGNKMLEILPDYDFYPDISSPSARERSIKLYEMDEGGAEIFTGTLESFLYEKYNIPSLLIELDGHGVIEERMKNIFSLEF